MGFGDAVASAAWTVCKQFAPCSRRRQTTIPAAHHSIFTGRMLFVMPNQQCQSTEARYIATELFTSVIFGDCWDSCILQNKQVCVQLLRQLTTYHCPHLLLRAGRAAIDRYLLAAGPTAANPPQWRVAAAWWDGQTDSQTDGQADARQLYRPCILYGQCQ